MNVDAWPIVYLIERTEMLSGQKEMIIDGCCQWNVDVFDHATTWLFLTGLLMGRSETSTCHWTDLPFERPGLIAAMNEPYLRILKQSIRLADPSLVLVICMQIARWQISNAIEQSCAGNLTGNNNNAKEKQIDADSFGEIPWSSSPWSDVMFFNSCDSATMSTDLLHVELLPLRQVLRVPHRDNRWVSWHSNTVSLSLATFPRLFLIINMKCTRTSRFQWLNSKRKNVSHWLFSYRYALTMGKGPVLPLPTDEIQPAEWTVPMTSIIPNPAFDNAKIIVRHCCQQERKDWNSTSIVSDVGKVILARSFALFELDEQSKITGTDQMLSRELLCSLD